jgi:hypothetical protein
MEMNEKKTYGILWEKWLCGFATIMWVLATYLAVLAGVVWLARHMAWGTPHEAWATAVFAVILCSGFHWILFTAVEHGQIKRMNEKQRDY